MQQSRTILRPRVVDARTGLSSTTRWRLERANKFPSRIQITESSVGYFEDEINDWIANRIRGGGKRPPLGNRVAQAEADKAGAV
jgi:prophage regulatory protein